MIHNELQTCLPTILSICGGMEDLYSLRHSVENSQVKQGYKRRDLLLLHD